jgi:hypothetical protein
MHNFRKVVFIFAIAILILACEIASAATPAPAQQNVATIVAGTLQALTAAAPPATVAVSTQTTQGSKVSFMNISLVIPSSLGAGASSINTDNIEMPPFTNPSNGPMPLHVVFSIQGYPIARKASIAVFKASEYAKYADFTQNVISQLQSLNFQAGGKIPQELGGSFEAAAIPLAIQKGHGLRYVTQVMQAVVPISNDQIYYYYQGMTNDNTYYVMAVLPVKALFVASTGNPDSAVPPNGIQFPPFSNPNATNDEIQNYYNAITQKMNNAAPNDFTPSLPTLDALIQSITVNP